MVILGRMTIPSRAHGIAVALALLLCGCTTLSLPPASPALQAHVGKAGSQVAGIGARLPDRPARPSAEEEGQYAGALAEIGRAQALAEDRYGTATGVRGRFVASEILASVAACRDAILLLRALHEGAALTRELFGMSAVGQTCTLPAETDALLPNVKAPRP